MDAKTIGKHRKGCRGVVNALAGSWPHPWSPYPERTEWRDKIGRKVKHGRPWIVFRCNDPNCPAEKIVKGDACVSLGSD